MARPWTEADYEAAGYRTIKLRLPAAAHEQLSALARRRGQDRTRVVVDLIADAHNDPRALKRELESVEEDLCDTEVMQHAKDTLWARREVLLEYIAAIESGASSDEPEELEPGPES